MGWQSADGHASTSHVVCKRVLLGGFVMNWLKCVKCLAWYAVHLFNVTLDQIIPGFMLESSCKLLLFSGIQSRTCDSNLQCEARASRESIEACISCKHEQTERKRIGASFSYFARQQWIPIWYCHRLIRVVKLEILVLNWHFWTWPDSPIFRWYKANMWNGTWFDITMLSDKTCFQD